MKSGMVLAKVRCRNKNKMKILSSILTMEYEAKVVLTIVYDHNI